MASIIVCQDTRTDLDFVESVEIPWEELVELRNRVRRLQKFWPTVGRQQIRVRWNSTDPLRIASDLLDDACDCARVAAELGDNLEELRDTVERFREQASVDAILLESLRRDGHQVQLFDSWTVCPDEKRWVKETNREHGVAVAADLMLRSAANGMVLDLNFHGDFQYGRVLLTNLAQQQVVNGEFCCVVFSKFLGEEGNTPEELVRRFPSLDLRFVNRMQTGPMTPIDIVRNHFRSHCLR